LKAVTYAFPPGYRENAEEEEEEYSEDWALKTLSVDPVPILHFTSL
jgi:hypothetical protein